MVDIRGGESARKKRRKKRKKVSVVEEGEVEEDEVEQQDAGEEGGFSQKTSTLESKGKGKAKETDYGKPGSPSKNGPSLLDRLADAAPQVQSSSGKRKISDKDVLSQEDSRDSEGASKKRRREKRERERDPDAP